MLTADHSELWELGFGTQADQKSKPKPTGVALTLRGLVFPEQAINRAVDSESFLIIRVIIMVFSHSCQHINYMTQLCCSVTFQQQVAADSVFTN